MKGLVGYIMSFQLKAQRPERQGPRTGKVGEAGQAAGVCGLWGSGLTRRQGAGRPGPAES